MKELSQLLLHVASGDEVAFRRLFDSFNANIYTTSLRISNDEIIAEDVVQDTFLKVWLNKEKLAAIDNFEGWLYTIARNITLNILKRKQHYKQYLHEEGSILYRIYPEADYQLQEKEFQSLLARAVERLPPKQLQTYRLIKEQFHKRAEVAAMLNVSPETVKSNIDQAMKSIRAYCMAHLKDMPLVLMLHFFTKYF